MFKPANWSLKDADNQIPLGEILPISRRARSLLARSGSHPVMNAGFLNMVGAVDLMGGMSYHHDNFLRLLDQIRRLPLLSSGRKELEMNLRHEAVAYINRVGQFYHFTASSFVSTHIPDWKDRIPTILRTKTFRDKHTAHRSLDKPLKTDTPHLQNVHAWAMSSIGGFILEPKPGKPDPSYTDVIKTRSEVVKAMEWTWENNFIGFQMLGNPIDRTVDFSVEKEHPLIESESYGIIERLLT